MYYTSPYGSAGAGNHPGELNEEFCALESKATNHSWWNERHNVPVSPESIVR